MSRIASCTKNLLENLGSNFCKKINKKLLAKMYLKNREKNILVKIKGVKNKEAPIKCLKKLWQNCAR